MKRNIVTVALLAASLVVAAAASAATRPYSGTVKENGLMIFDLKTPKHGLPTVKDFRFGKGVPTSCDEGDTTVGDHLVDTDLPFYDRNHFRLDSQLSETTKIYGERVKNGKFKGTLRWKTPELDAGHHNCDTGKLHWKAEKTPPM